VAAVAFRTLPAGHAVGAVGGAEPALVEAGWRIAVGSETGKPAAAPILKATLGPPSGSPTNSPAPQTLPE
jgi:hypothetical protein